MRESFLASQVSRVILGTGEKYIYPVKSGILTRIPSHHFHIFAKRPGHSLSPKLREHLYLLEIESRNKSLFDSVQIFIRYLNRPSQGIRSSSTIKPYSSNCYHVSISNTNPRNPQAQPLYRVPFTARSSRGSRGQKDGLSAPFPFSESQPNDQAKRLTTTSGRSRSQDCSSRGPDPRDGRKSEEVGCAAKVSL